MPIGGETVGRAYVRIFADGSEVPGGIRDSIKDAEPSVKEAGRDAGRTYADEFNKEYRKSFRGNFGKTQGELIDEINTGLTSSLSRLKLADNFFGNRNKGWKEFRTRLVDEFGDAGDLAGSRLEQQFRDSANLEGLAAVIERIGPEVRKAQKDILVGMEEDAQKLREDRDRELETHFDSLLDLHKDFERGTRELIAETDDIWKQSQRDRLAGARAAHTTRMGLLTLEGSIERSITKDTREGLLELTAAVRGLESGEKDLILTHRQAIRTTDRLRESLTDLPDDERRRLSFEIEQIDDRLKRVTPISNRFNETMDKFHNTVAVGRGSRNDFIHFLGSINRGFARLLTLVPRLTLRIGEEMFTAFTQAGGGLSGLVKSVGALAPLAGAAIAGLAGIALAAGALVIAMGPLVALFSGLLGIATALSSTVIFALIGGLGVLAGALVPVAAGIGAIVLGLTTMSDTLKDRLERQVKPLTDQFKDLGQVVREELFKDVPQQAQNLATALESVEPVAEKVARAVRNVGTSWSEALAGKGFRDFNKTMETFLPRAIRLLGSVAENTASALGGMFEAATPAIEDFLRWLNRVTERWSEWANSAEGADDIAGFLDKAGDSASSLGDFLGELLDVISELLDAGNKPGNNIFDSMADSLANFADHLRENPEALDDWFEAAQDLAETIGDLIVDLGELFGELDNEDNREAIRDIIDLIGNLAEALGELSEVIGPVLGPLVTLLSTLTDLSDKIEDFSGSNPLGGLIGAITQLGDLGPVDWTQALGLDAIADGLLRPFEAAAGQLGGLVDGFIAPFRGLGQQISDVAGFIDLRNKIRIPTMGDVTNWISGWAGNLLAKAGLAKLITNIRIPRLSEVTGWIAGWAGSLLSKAGIARLLQNIKIPSIGDVSNWIGGWAAATLRKAGIVRLIENFDIPSLGDIASKFAGLGGLIKDTIGSINIPIIPQLAMGGVFGELGSFREAAERKVAQENASAQGRITRGPMYALIGEDGPEAVVPLRRPLSQVDPSVRWLSAIAQGLTGSPEMMASGGTRGKSVDASGWTIISPQSDARAVADEAIVRLVATAYT